MRGAATTPIRAIAELQRFWLPIVLSNECAAIHLDIIKGVVDLLPEITSQSPHNTRVGASRDNRDNWPAGYKRSEAGVTPDGLANQTPRAPLAVTPCHNSPTNAKSRGTRPRLCSFTRGSNRVRRRAVSGAVETLFELFQRDNKETCKESFGLFGRERDVSLYSKSLYRLYSNAFGSLRRAGSSRSAAGK